MDNLKIIYKKTEDLIPYINNPRNNDNAVDKVASSIKNFGFKVPIVVDGDNEIIAGHTRLKAAKKLGMDEVPCIVADDLNDGQIKAFRLADNKVSEFADWDMEMLEKELLDIKDIDIDFKMEDFGFSPLKNEEEVEITERELVPFIKVHYLISADLNKNDQILEILDRLKEVGGIEIESSLN
ncbi:MAG: ParB N-terminal domain-containing protein [Aedoeadaptatus pacaensis]